MAAAVPTPAHTAFMGFQLDPPLDSDPQARQKAVADLAYAIAALELT